MDNTQLILTLCELVETQNAETLGTTAAPAVQFSQQGETKK